MAGARVEMQLRRHAPELADAVLAARASGEVERRAHEPAGLRISEEIFLSFKTGKGLRKLALELDAERAAEAAMDRLLRVKDPSELKRLCDGALDKLLARRDWIELWEVVFQSEKQPAARKAAVERLAGANATAGEAEKFSYYMKEHMGHVEELGQVRDRESASLLCDWLAKNRMWEFVWSAQLWGGKHLKAAAGMRLAAVTVEEAKLAAERDYGFSKDWANDIKDPDARRIVRKASVEQRCEHERRIAEINGERS